MTTLGETITAEELRAWGSKPRDTAMIQEAADYIDRAANTLDFLKAREQELVKALSEPCSYEKEWEAVTKERDALKAKVAGWRAAWLEKQKEYTQARAELATRDKELLAMKTVALDNQLWGDCAEQERIRLETELIEHKAVLNKFIEDWECEGGGLEYVYADAKALSTNLAAAKADERKFMTTEEIEAAPGIIKSETPDPRDLSDEIKLAAESIINYRPVSRDDREGFIRQTIRYVVDAELSRHQKQLEIKNGIL